MHWTTVDWTSWMVVGVAVSDLTYQMRMVAEPRRPRYEDLYYHGLMALTGYFSPIITLMFIEPYLKAVLPLGDVKKGRK